MKNFKLILPIAHQNGKFTILNVDKISILSNKINRKELISHILKQIEKIKTVGGELEPMWIKIQPEAFDEIIKEIKRKQLFDYDMRVINIYDDRNNNLVNIIKTAS